MTKTRTKTLAGLTLLAGVVVLAGIVWAGPARDPVSGSGASSAINEYQFAGTAKLVIRGQEKWTDLLVTVLAPPRISDDGVQHVDATHTFTFIDGSTITTSDKEIAEPTDIPGLYIINANMKVVSGTGIYEGVSGHLSAHGTIDFAAQPPAAEFELRGSITHVE
jgi:hypothetical protein